MDIEKTLKSKRLMVGVLSMSFLLSASNAISGTIPAMEEAFSNVSKANVELLTTIPTAGVMVGTVLTGVFSNYLGKKKSVLSGLLIACIAGILPTFFPEYWPILISRFMFGVGMGVFNPLSVSYITDLYEGDRQRSLLGYRQAASNLGDTVMLFIAGLLITISWNATYLVFLVLLVPVVLITLFVPKEFDNFNIKSSSVDEEGHIHAAETSARPSTNWKVIFLAVVFMLISMFYNVIALKFASYVVTNGIGTAATATWIFSFLVLAAIFSGILFEKISKITKRLTVFIFEIVIGVCYVAVAFVHNVPVLMALVLLGGFAWGIINPALTSRLVDVSPANSMNLSTSIIVITINIGFLISPYFFAMFAHLFGNDSPALAIIIGGVLYLVVAAIDLITVKADKQLTI
ncbi:MFS transporter [Bifidobacterium catulorum]|uniref:MFS transporter n=1 Tax=Bifidobacterium catulorum TaxID=1630173 RepID=A0A2U2MQ32_9BIFI|nr:MFS transporter [Bifidobacterium catulorum]PWG58951.1 MFS transporter [Bifidobacterium catulorum]